MADVCKAEKGGRRTRGVATGEIGPEATERRLRSTGQAEASDIKGDEGSKMSLVEEGLVEEGEDAGDVEIASGVV